MNSSRMPGFVQFLPLIVFATYAFWDGTPTDARWVEAFKLGGLAALGHLFVVLRRGRPADRLILGVNLYLLAGGLAAFTQQWWFLRYYGALKESAIFLFMLGVGAVATFATAAGFLGVADAPPATVRRYSLWMLAATIAALGISFVFHGNTRLSAGVPVAGLAILQRVLAQRAQGAPAATSLPRMGRIAIVLVASIVLALARPQVAELQPADLVTQGRAALDADRVDDALSLLEKAVAADPKNPPALAWLGAAQVRKARTAEMFERPGWVKRGFDTLDEAVERFPEAFIVHLLRGLNGAQVPDMFRKAPAAVKDLRAVVAMKEKDPTTVPDTVMPAVYLNLGIAHRKNGQPVEARAAWEKGKQLYPGAPEVKAIDRELRGL
jgi:tetratricopeptide (TPR) repeat protein